MSWSSDCFLVVASWLRVILVRGIFSTAISWSMIDAVSRPETRPLIWMPAMRRAPLRGRSRVGFGAEDLAQGDGPHHAPVPIDQRCHHAIGQAVRVEPHVLA